MFLQVVSQTTTGCQLRWQNGKIGSGEREIGVTDLRVWSANLDEYLYGRESSDATLKIGNAFSRPRYRQAAVVMPTNPQGGALGCVRSALSGRWETEEDLGQTEAGRGAIQ